jgi:Uma2 family endonuclease
MGRQVIETETIDLPRLRMTYQEFLDWSGDTTHAEWVDGEVIAFMPPKTLHQLTVSFFHRLLSLFTEVYDLGMVMTAPYEMLLPDGSAREPDLLFVATRHLDRIDENRLVGPADWVSEILSDSTAAYDRRQKFEAYLRARVPEYWMVDPRPRYRRIEAYSLNLDGQYELIPPDSEGRIWSRVLPGFWVDPAWFWQSPLPSPIKLMQVIAPDAYRAFLSEPFPGAE